MGSNAAAGDGLFTCFRMGKPFVGGKYAIVRMVVADNYPVRSRVGLKNVFGSNGFFIASAVL